LPDQLTPFDFWELVAETKALDKDVPDPQGRELHYRIDTSKIFNQYAHWLGNVIRHKCNITWPNVKPDTICTVKEQSGKEGGGVKFAKLVSQSLNVKKITSIERDDLNRVTPGGGLPTGAYNPFEGKDNVLIVDDGINYGITMKKLIAYCKTAGATILGVLVFDNRLDEQAITKIRYQMGRAELVSLYEWPATSGSL